MGNAYPHRTLALTSLAVSGGEEHRVDASVSRVGPLRADESRAAPDACPVGARRPATRRHGLVLGNSRNHDRHGSVVWRREKPSAATKADDGGRPRHL